jgi:hypothetical protein
MNQTDPAGPTRRAVPAFVLETGAPRRGSVRFVPRIDPRMRDLVARSAALPRGLALLHRGPLETVASALDAPVGLVETVREALDGPERERLLEAHATARALLRAPAPARSPARPAPPAGPAELERAARNHPMGLDFLLRGHFEAVAVAFGVHPDLVQATRDLVAAR